MIFNLKPCWVGESSGNNPDKPGTTSYAARCPVHEWEVRRDIPSYLPDGEWNGEGVRWSRNEARKHEDLFRRIAVARACAQVALDEQLQRRLTSIAMWEGERFDGNFLVGLRVNAFGWVDVER